MCSARAVRFGCSQSQTSGIFPHSSPRAISIRAKTGICNFRPPPARPRTELFRTRNSESDSDAWVLPAPPGTDGACFSKNDAPPANSWSLKSVQAPVGLFSTTHPPTPPPTQAASVMEILAVTLINASPCQSFAVFHPPAPTLVFRSPLLFQW